MVLALVVVLVMTAGLSYPSRAGNLGFSGEISLPKVESYRTDTGVRVFHIKDDLPRVVIVISAGLGKLYENRANAGLSEVMAKMFSLGGCDRYPGNALYSRVESLGGRISISASWEQTSISLSVLARHAPEAWDILKSLMEAPRFEEKYFEEARSLIKEELKREKDKASESAIKKMREILYDGNGYGASVTEKSLDALTLETVRKAWGTHFTSGNLSVGVSSSLDVPTVRKALNEVFARTAPGEKKYYRVDEDRLIQSLKEKNGNIYLVPRDIPQATLVVGTIAPGITYEGNETLQVMNYILGMGSFNARLMREIRVKRGLSYSVWSVIRNRKNSGLFMAFAQTRNDSLGETLRLMEQNISLVGREGVTGEELAWAKKSLSNSYIFEFDTTGSILDKYLFLDYNELRETYLKDYLKRVNAVTREGVLKQSGILFGRGFVRVVVGKKDLAKDLGKYGKVILLED